MKETLLRIALIAVIAILVVIAIVSMSTNKHSFVDNYVEETVETTSKPEP